MIVQLVCARRIGGVRGRALVELLDLLDFDILQAAIHLVDRCLPLTPRLICFMARLLHALHESSEVLNEVPFVALSSGGVVFRRMLRWARHSRDGESGVGQRRVRSFMRLRRTKENKIK